MPTTKTPEQIALIRLAFNSNGRPGVLESIVRAEHEKVWDVTVDMAGLLRTYAEFNCPNVVKFAEFLAIHGDKIKEVGSGSIDLSGVTQDEFSIVGALSLQELYIGSSDGKITPLQWLRYLANGLPGLPPEQIQAFDDICSDFYLFATAVETDGDVL